MEAASWQFDHGPLVLTSFLLRMYRSALDNFRTSFPFRSLSVFFAKTTHHLEEALEAEAEAVVGSKKFV